MRVLWVTLGILAMTQGAYCGHAQQFQQSVPAGQEELVAEELRLAARALGRLAGRVDVEDVLDVIFRDFCIGK